MTRPLLSPLVLDGEDIKARLMAERMATKSVVHVDWLRFTVYRRYCLPSEDVLFPLPVTDNIWDVTNRLPLLKSAIDGLQDGELTATAEAYELAQDVVDVLGPDFEVASEIRKGHDFYKYRLAIERNGQEVGWVGFISAAKKKTTKNKGQLAQGATLHCNLYGAACTFAQHGWADNMARLIDFRRGDITRCDLALDFFDGMSGGVDQVVEDYKAGLCNVGGKELVCNQLGDWIHGKGRSFYMGSKEAGKQTNVYEKGHQLFGPDSGSQWLRVELRYGNKLRVLSTDMLRRPSDFFAGASDWHQLMLTRADAIATAEPIKTNGRLALETVEAEVTRNLKWVFNVAAPSMAAAFDYLPDYETFKELVTNKKLPGRLQKFKPAELAKAFGKAINRFVSPIDSPAMAMAI